MTITRDNPKHIRIAFLSNMNNNHFSIARYLRDRGFDCSLLLFNNEIEHFHPKCDTYNLSYTTWVKSLNWGDPSKFLSTTADTIRKDLQNYDIIIGCGLAPAYCYKAGIKLDIFIPYGGDIWTETFYKLVAPHRLLSSWLATYYQRKGFQKVRLLHATYSDQIYENQIGRYFKNTKRIITGVPIVYYPEYSKDILYEIINKTHWGQEFIKIRNSAELMVVAHGRHVWGDKSDPNTKGNDVLIQGWSIFCQRNPLVAKKLVFLEYGRDVDKSKELVSRLCPENTVVWLPKMYRKDIIPGLLLADIVAAEFCHSWLGGGVIYEALVAGKPLLTYRDEKTHGSQIETLYPVYNAKTPEQVADRLQEYITNPEKGKNMGIIGQNWYHNEVVNRAIKEYSDYFSQCAKEIGKDLICADLN
ncbi:hypothetical protein RYO59_002462 [Thermosynechococcaceae cyanobacterium Okahandja]